MSAMTEELLISRMVQGTAGPSDWAALACLAETEPQVWSRLAEAQADQAALCDGVNRAIEAADRIDLPGSIVSSSVGSALQQERRLWSWSGWAIAALLALAWTIGQFLPLAQPTAPYRSDIAAEHLAVNDVPLDDMLSRYLSKGKEAGLVIGELPEKVLLSAQPLEDGSGYELLYLRQLLERTQVPDMYEFGGQDESGRPTLVKYDHSQGQSL